MLGKALAKIAKSPPPSSPKPLEDSSSLSMPGSKLATMLSVSGRIGLPHLQRMRLMYDKEEFARLMARPALVGSAILAGTLYEQPVKNVGDKNRTVAFEPLPTSDELSVDGDTLKHAIYPLVKQSATARKRIVFLIGRADDNDMIMPDFAISKRHAMLEVEVDEYWMKDCNSTNGTLLNENRLGQQPVQLHDGDIISFARYAFAFLSPESLYERLK